MIIYKRSCQTLQPWLRSPPLPAGDCWARACKRRCGATRTLLTASQSRSDAATEQPRWQQTPPAMRAPYRFRPPIPNNEFTVNEDPKRLDAVYVRMLGPSGHEMLSEETKWLAVTHKSFDGGCRGFNDRLAYLGKRIVELQTTLALIGMRKTPTRPGDSQIVGDERTPFRHPAYSGLGNVTEFAKARTLEKRRMCDLAVRYGLGQVTRWKPTLASNLLRSGMYTVFAQSLYAVIGALALERGGEVARQAARESILRPLGVLGYSSSS